MEPLLIKILFKKQEEILTQGSLQDLVQYIKQSKVAKVSDGTFSKSNQGGVATQTLETRTKSTHSIWGAITPDLKAT